MTIMPFGERALLVNFEQRIDPLINDQVLGLYRYLSKTTIPGITFLTPAYCSLTVGFDPTVIDSEKLKNKLTEIATKKIQSADNQITTHRIPVCYHPDFAPDITDVAKQLNLAIPEIIHWHTSQTYRVYMLGFLPGFPYLGILPAVLQLPRRAQPRTNVPAGSVAIANGQTGIYPQAAPGGWHLIGRTSVRCFDEKRTPPFLFAPVDEVIFYAVDELPNNGERVE